MDETIINKIRQGDEKAFEEIYRTYYEMLCRFAARILRNPALAEEVVDDVLFYVWDHREDIEIQSLRAYLVRAVRNNSMKTVSTRTYRTETASVNISDEEWRIDEYLADSDHPIGWLIEQEMEQMLVKAIDNLPTECRKVFNMSRFEGMRYADIATELSISVNTVKYHMKNAIRILSRQVAPYLLLWILVTSK